MFLRGKCHNFRMLPSSFLLLLLVGTLLLLVGTVCTWGVLSQEAVRPWPADQ